MRVSLSQRQQAATQVKSTTVSASPPVGGLNTVSALVDMPANDAPVLDNWFPDGSRVVSRKGYNQYYDYGSALPVETLISYMGNSATHLLAAVDGKVINITSAGSPVTLSTGNTNDRYEYAFLSNYIQMVNGADGPYSWEGTTWASPAWTGVSNPEQFIGVSAYKSRLYFFKDNDSNFYYSTVNAVAGALAAFDLANISRKGGKIVAINTIGPQFSGGPQDLICFFMSSGEFIIYQGSDPGDAANWSLLGTWNISEVMSARSVIKIAGDLLIQTKDDYYRVTEIMNQEKGLKPESKIGPTLRTSVRAGSSKFGWSATVLQESNIVIFNAPTSTDAMDQHVLNLDNNSFCRYKNIPSQCWAVHDGSIYFGTSGGIVHEAETGNTDNGAAIECDGQTSYNAFGTVDRKHVTAIRSLMKGQGDFTYSIGIDFDYEGSDVATPVSVAIIGTPWGSPWGSPWSSPIRLDNSWRFATGSGSAASIRAKVNALQSIEWLRSDLEMAQGTAL